MKTPGYFDCDHCEENAGEICQTCHGAARFIAADPWLAQADA